MSTDVTYPTVKWPVGGRNSRFMIVNIPSITQSLVDKTLAFISSNCCYVTKDKIRRFISIQGIERNAKSANPIQLEHFLADVVDADHDASGIKIDYSRYQSSPRDSDRLMQCASIKRIVHLTQSIVHKQLVGAVENTTFGYAVTRVTLLFSKPGGLPQQLHIDDSRDDLTMANEGEMLSAIVALQDCTRLDIEGDNGKRLTYSIPPTSMFLFSGICKHGGSSYNRFNVRLHMYMFPTQTAGDTERNIDNVIVVNCPCPISECQNSKEGETFTTSQLYYHWNKYHLKEEGLSLGKFIERRNGGTVIQCDLCRKGFNTKRGLGRHKKNCRLARKSLK